MTQEQHSEQLSSINSALKDIESYIILINKLQFIGSDSGTVESMRKHFISVRQQLLNHLQTLAEIRLPEKTNE